MAQRDVVVAARGGGIVFIGKLFAWGTRFVLAVILARLLGADGYGLYNLALTIATVAASIPTLGLDAAIVRYVAIFAGRGDHRSLIGAAQIGIGVPAALSIVAGVIVFFAAEPISTRLMDEPRLAPLLGIVSVLVVAMVVTRQLGATLQGFKRIDLTVLAEQFTQPLVRFALIAVFAVLGLTVVHALVASTVAALIVTVMLGVLVRRQLPRLAAGVASLRPTGELVRFSLPIFFSNVVTTVGSNLQTLFLGALSTVASVGIFAVASHINMVGSIFQQAVVSASMPLFAEAHDRDDRDSLEHLYRTTSKWSFSANLPLFILVVAFPQGLLALFGPEFAGGAAALVILAWANLINAATGTSGAVLDMTGWTKVKLLNSTVAVVLGIGLNLLLIPPLGLVGAAVAAMVALSSVNLLRLLEVWLLVRVTPYDRSWVKPVTAGAAALGAGLVVGTLAAGGGPLLQLAVAAIVVLGTYGAVLAALGLSGDDRLVLARAKARFLRRGRRGGRDETSVQPDDTSEEGTNL